MPICNVIDRRANPYRTRIKVVYEETWHFNSEPEADAYREPNEYEVISETRNYVTVRESIEYAEKWRNAITMLMYDANAEIDE